MLIDPEKIIGELRAVVVNVVDPEERQFIQVRVDGLWDKIPAENLPWAEIKLPIGTRANEGGWIPLKVGDRVWIDFIQGDSRYPRITGACHHAIGGELSLPHDIFDGSDAITHKRTDLQPAATKSTDKAAVFSIGNALFEVKEDGVIRVTHKSTGSAIELTKDGDMVLHSEAKLFISAKEDMTIEAAKKLTLIVEGLTEILGKENIVLKSDKKLIFDAIKYEFQ